MNARKLTGHRWINQVAGVVLMGAGVIAISQPAPRMSLCSLESAALHRLAPIARRTEVGRQVLAIYVERGDTCHRDTI